MLVLVVLTCRHILRLNPITRRLHLIGLPILLECPHLLHFPLFQPMVQILNAYHFLVCFLFKHFLGNFANRLRLFGDFQFSGLMVDFDLVFLGAGFSWLAK